MKCHFLQWSQILALLALLDVDQILTSNHKRVLKDLYLSLIEINRFNHFIVHLLLSIRHFVSVEFQQSRMTYFNSFLEIQFTA